MFIFMVSIIVCCIVMPRIFRCIMGFITASLGACFVAMAFFYWGAVSLAVVMAPLLIIGGTICQTCDGDYWLFGKIGLESYVTAHKTTYVSNKTEVHNNITVQVAAP